MIRESTHLPDSGCRMSALVVWALVTGLVGTGRADDVPFTEHVLSTTAEGAYCVTAADLDGDGDIDVLAASWADDQIAWFENDGGSPPTFTERIITEDPDGWGPAEGYADGVDSVAAADLNGDGYLDVVFAADTIDRVAWYENDGGSPPTFTPQLISDVAWGAFSVDAVDVNDDGHVDVIAALAADDRVVWYRNNGASPPAFTAYDIAAGVNQPACVHAADLEADGDIDVVMAISIDDEVAWYHNDGSSTPLWTRHVASSYADFPRSVYTADMNGDGYVDILSAWRNDDHILYHESDGGTPPAFTTYVISSSANFAVSVFAADVDGDGDTDVLSASQFDHKIAWYDNDGGSPPSFTERVLPVSAAWNGASSVYAVDIDNDGDTDVLGALDYADSIAWYENESPPPCEGTLYGVTLAGKFLEIDTTTGAATELGTIDANPGSMASDSSNQIFTIYADELILVDPTTPSASTVYLTLTDRPPGYSVTGMAFNSSDELYVVLNDSGSPSLLATVDMTTGQIDLVGGTGETGLDGLQGLAFNETDTLHAMDVWDGLCTLDPATGLVDTIIGGSGIGLDDQAIEFCGGQLFGARANLLDIDPATGDATLIGATGFPSVYGLAAVTETSSGGSLGDLNCDDLVDFFDIETFVMALTDPDGYALAYPDCDITLADCNEDGVVDFFDIDSFVALVVGG